LVVVVGRVHRVHRVHVTIFDGQEGGVGYLHSVIGLVLCEALFLDGGIADVLEGLAARNIRVLHGNFRKYFGVANLVVYEFYAFV